MLQEFLVQPLVQPLLGEVTPTLPIQDSLALWYDAADEDTIESSNNLVSQLDDKSGNERHATQSTETSKPRSGGISLNGRNLVDFDTGRSMTIPHIPDMHLNATVFTVMISQQGRSANTFGNHIFINGAGQRQPLIFGTKSLTSPYMAISSGTGPTRDFQYNSGDDHRFGRPVVATHWTDGTNVDARVAGAKNYSALATTMSSVATAGSMTGEFSLAELIVYDRPLEDDEQAEVETYLADKWGCYHPNAEWFSEFSAAHQTIITASKLSKSEAQALLVGNEVAWFDASDLTTITETAGAVSQLDDKFNANHVVQATGSKQPTSEATLLNGLNVLDFDGGDQLDLDTDDGILSITEGSNTIFAVVKQTTDGVSDRIVNGTIGGGSKYMLKYPTTASSIEFFSNASATALATTASETTKAIVMHGRRDGTTQAASAQGGAEATDTNGANAFLDAITIGGYTGAADQLNGSIAEIIIYDTSLTAAQITAIEVYLADKWGVYHPSANWINGFDSVIQDMIHVSKLNRDEAELIAESSIKLWLDASDEDTITESSGSVSQWDDRSGNDNHCVQATGSEQPTTNATTQNSLNVLDFDGGDELESNTGLGISGSDGGTIFIVAQTSDGNIDNYPFNIGEKTAPREGKIINFDLNTSTNLSGFRYANGNRLFSSPFDSSWHYSRWTWADGADYQSHDLYVDGVVQTQISTSSGATVPNISDEGYLVGAGNGASGGNGGLRFDGSIGEIIVFDEVPSATVITLMENYLETKWGI